jgi:cell division transport system permease protein
MGPRARYLLGELGVGLRRNTLMVAATVVTVTVSLALLGAGLLVQRQVNEAQRVFYSDIEVSIFLQDGISESARNSLEEDLNDTPIVQSVEYESKEDAFAHFQEIFADEPVLLDSVEPEILPASFRVQLVDPEQFGVIQSQFACYPGVQEVSDGREFLNQFFTVMRRLRDGALWVGFLQAIAAVALIFNVIRITAFARREQTGIMKLVGATNWYIRLPFILEGMVAGVAGALLAGGLLALGQATLIQGLSTEILFVPFISMGDVLRVIPVLVAAGALISALASFISLRRFLAV